MFTATLTSAKRMGLLVSCRAKKAWVRMRLSTKAGVPIPYQNSAEAVARALSS